MPIYEYVCTACDHRADILHGINDPGPHFCPSCGQEGAMRKLFAPPAIHYKGTGWAKKDRVGTRAAGSRSSEGAAAAETSASAAKDGGGSAGEPAASGGNSTSSNAAAADGSGV